MPTGGFAEFAAIGGGAATAIPDDVPADVALVLLGVNYPGGVGSAAVQIASAEWCRVIATAGSEGKLAVYRALGAETAIGYADGNWVDAVREATGGGGADAIYDPVGGRVGTDSLRCPAWQGRLLVFGSRPAPSRTCPRTDCS